MGFKIGVDFGTTNSTIAFVNRSNVLEAFRYPGPEGYEYIPSCVAYEKDGSISVGRGAMKVAGDPETIFCDNLKMILPLSDSERAKYEWTKDKSPETVIRDYLMHILKDTEDGFESKNKIDGIVLSVPHVWAKALNHAGRSRLQKIISEAGLPLIQLISEPVAAAAYYAYATPFQGNLLVCDMGGGTFDVTLCKITPGKIEELYNDGNGRTSLGKAGVFFDRKLLLEKDPAIEENSKKFYRIYNDLQSYKTDRNKEIKKGIINAIETPEYRQRPVLKLDIYDFNYEDISKAFIEVNDSINTVLLRFRQAIEKMNYKVDTFFLVGGFGQFYMVREAIKKFWGLGENDPRFIEEADNVIARYAIAFGAALVANNLITVEEKYEHTVGVRVFRLIPSSTVKAFEQQQGLLPIIQGGKKLSEYEKVQFAVDLVKAHNAKPDITIYVDAGSKGRPVVRKLPEDLGIELPDANRPGNQWQIGMRINKSKVVYLIFRDLYGKTVEYELGDLLRQMFGGLEICGEESDL